MSSMVTLGPYATSTIFAILDTIKKYCQFLQRKVCQDKNCPLQGLYPFSKTTFQGFSRTSPGLKLIFPGLKNSLSAINFLYCHFSLRIWCSILPVVYEFLNSYHLTNGSKRVNDFSVVGAFLKFSSSSLTV